MDPQDSTLEEDEECFVFTVPEGGEEDDVLVYPVLPEDEAAELLASL